MEEESMRIADERLPSLSSVADGMIEMIERPSEDIAKGCVVEASKEVITEHEHVAFVSYFARALLLSWVCLIVRFAVSEIRVARQKCKRNNELKFTWVELFQYRLEHHFSTSKWAKPMLLLSATSILILVGGAMLAIVTTNEDFTFDSDSAWIAWTYVADPGTHADAEGTAVRFVSFCITIGGMLVFALMIGIISDEISGRVDDLKEGKSRVIESNHTLMLGWSDKSLAIIEQIALANESEGGGYIVVLADMSKVEMEQQLNHAMDSNERPLKLLGTTVVFRSGNPIMEHELSKVGVSTARAIIALSPMGVEPDEADSTMVRQVLALNSCELSAHIVVEMQDIDNKALITMVSPDNVEVVVAHDIIGRLMIQCAREPGLAHVIESLLGFDGDEFYFENWEKLTGCTFFEVTCRFDDAVPIGVKKASGYIDINPPNDYVIQENDRILCLAEDNDTYTANDGSFLSKCIVLSQKLKAAKMTIPRRGKEKLLFCGWRRDMADMIVQLDEYVAPGSELWLFNQVPASERVELLKDKDNKDEVRCSHLAIKNVVGNPIVRRHLKILNAVDNNGEALNEVSTVDQFDSILILSDEDASTCEDSDSRSIATLLIIQDVQRNLIDKKKKLMMDEKMNSSSSSETITAKVLPITTVDGDTTDMNNNTNENDDETECLCHEHKCVPISEILDTRTRSLLSVVGCTGYVMSNHIVSLWMSQVAEDRDMNAVLSELLSAKGCETYIRSVDHYIHISSCQEEEQKAVYCFWDLALLARQRREVAIGYKPHNMEWRDSTDLILNPPNKNVPRVWDMKDMLLVIAFD
mmetsp:Transcript_17989/g.23847  ORF Transcript_17989/g.23847 Transcript_17989/m.23847 type:complete len:812 (+) Transcript_17989:61-2496(+)